MSYKATIVLACYNKEKFVERSLQSIVDLSRFNDFEVFIVDDKSTDNSVELIKNFSNKYENINLVEFEVGSGSPSKPRNVGIEMSTTPYIIFADPDDMIVNDGFSTLLTKMEEYDSDIIIAAREGINEKGVKKFVDFIEENPYINENNINIQKDLLNRYPYILKTIYSKKLLNDNNIRFIEEITTSEDEIFDMTCLAYAKKVTKINDIVYRYTVEATGSITTRVTLSIYQQLLVIIPELDRVYSMMFDEQTVINRIGKLVSYYLGRVAFLSNYAEIDEALEYIYQSCSKIGYDRLLKIEDDNERLHVFLLEKKDYVALSSKMFLRRLRMKDDDIRAISKEKNKISKKYKKLSNRKIVKFANMLSRKIK